MLQLVEDWNHPREPVPADWDWQKFPFGPPRNLHWKFQEVKVRPTVSVRHLREVRFEQSGELGRGCYGTYFRLDRRHGVKVFRNTTVRNGKVCPHELERAEHELELQNIAHAHGLAVKAHRLVVARVGKQYHLGLMMTHIKGPLLSRAGLSLSYETKVRHNLYQKLLEAGINHSDLHHSNIMQKGKRGKWYAIDYGITSYFGKRPAKKVA